MPDPAPYARLAVLLAAAFAVAAAVFTIWPEIDLKVSGLFYTPATGFGASGPGLVEMLRQTIWAMTEGLLALSILFWILSAFGRRIWGIPGRLWAFVAMVYVLAPGVIANLILKSHWGRARPADVTAFGGDKTFSPALIPSDQCASNCSFVSGEGSGAVALGLSLFVLSGALRGRLSDGMITGIRLAAIVLAIMGSAFRVVAGRHFLSDTVFAALIVLSVGLVLHRLLLADLPKTDPARR